MVQILFFLNSFILFLHLKRQSQAWSVMTLQICDLWWHFRSVICDLWWHPIKTIIIIIFNCHFHSAQQCIKTLDRIFTMIIHVRRFINTSPTHRLMIFQESNFYQLPKKWPTDLFSWKCYHKSGVMYKKYPWY